MKLAMCNLGKLAILLIILVDITLSRKKDRTRLKVDSLSFKTDCNINFYHHLLVYPTAMSQLDRDYFLQILNTFRNSAAKGDFPKLKPSRNMGYVQYDFALEYIATCCLRRAMLGRRAFNEYDKKYGSFADFEGKNVSAVYYFLTYDRAIDSRKGLFRFASTVWLNLTEGQRKDAIPIVKTLWHHAVRAVGCGKLISMEFAPYVSYSILCLFKYYKEINHEALLDINYNKNTRGKPKLNHSRAYPALRYYRYVVQPFTPPLEIEGLTASRAVYILPIFQMQGLLLCWYILQA